MARLLFTWELGAGLGHVANLRPLIERLANEGHTIHVALRDVTASRALAPFTFQLHQAPHLNVAVRDNIPVPRTHAQILHNTGFATVDELRALVEAWRGLFQSVEPDVVLMEHSPTALVASHTLPLRRVLIGTGFCTPPDIYPLPNFRPWEIVDATLLRRDEDRVHDHVGTVLASYQHPSWPQLSKLYADVDANILLTLPEFDHYSRQTTPDSYYGSWPITGGASVEWPAGKGPRVFGYLKPFPSFGNLVSLLKDLRTRTVLYAPDVSQELQRRFRSDTLCFLTRKVDLTEVAKTCDLAILNANVSSATTFYLQGVPSFHVPLYLEQAIFARRFVELGGGLAADPDRPERIGSRLTTMLRSPRFAENARNFADAHREFSLEREIDRGGNN